MAGGEEDHKSGVWRWQSRNVIRLPTVMCLGIHELFSLPVTMMVVWDWVKHRQAFEVCLCLAICLNESIFYMQKWLVRFQVRSLGYLGAFKNSLDTLMFKRLLWDPVTKWGHICRAHLVRNGFLSTAASLASDGNGSRTAVGAEIHECSSPLWEMA